LIKVHPIKRTQKYCLPYRINTNWKR